MSQTSDDFSKKFLESIIAKLTKIEQEFNNLNANDKGGQIVLEIKTDMLLLMIYETMPDKVFDSSINALPIVAKIRDVANIDDYQLARLQKQRKEIDLGNDMDGSMLGIESTDLHYMQVSHILEERKKIQSRNMATVEYRPKGCCTIL